jgi:MFS superfamily sulfate permease-like transporter
LHLETLHDALKATAADPKMVPDFLVKLPDSLLAGIVFPDWSQITSATSIKYIIMFTLVGSLESLLTVKAIDILDPYKRKSNLNKDLLAVGIGNTLCGLLGGLPMIAEVVRSSANINNGGVSRWGNVAHGVFLLIYLAFLGFLINMVPLAGLAAMLIFTGYRLAGPSHWMNARAIGIKQFAIFTTTVLVTLATDLLIGMLAGVVMNMALNMRYGGDWATVFKPKYRYDEEGNNILLTITDSAVFSNWIGLKAKLESIPVNKKLIIDVSEANIVDHPVVEALDHYKEERLREGQEVEIRGYEALTAFTQHPHSTRRRTK